MPLTIRASERYRLKVSVVAKHSRSMRRIEAELWDLSVGGCRIVTTEPVSPGDQLLIKIERLEGWPATVVWTGTGCCGVSFHAPLHYSVAEHYARSFPCTISDAGKNDGSTSYA
jgi:hypothetical protein